MKPLDDSQIESLERMIDNHSLESVLFIIAYICMAKAEHVMVNWQGVVLSKAWSNQAINAEKAARHAQARGL